mgnify:CR=1 FL=1
MRVDSEPAFVLHVRPYRESSQLVDIFSRHYGRFRAVAKGFRRAKNTAKQLSPFTPLLVSWSGKSDLKSLLSAEQTGASLMLVGERLYSGFYLNELLLRLLAVHDPHQQLFDSYFEILAHLAADVPIEPPLRKFEFCLLEEIGYGLVMDVEASTGEPISQEQWYWFDPTIGFVSGIKSNKNSPNWFLGSDILAIQNFTDQNLALGRVKKRLTRLAIEPHLGNKPLSSRALFSGVSGVSSILSKG